MWALEESLYRMHVALDRNVDHSSCAVIAGMSGCSGCTHMPTVLSSHAWVGDQMVDHGNFA